MRTILAVAALMAAPASFDSSSNLTAEPEEAVTACPLVSEPGGDQGRTLILELIRDITPQRDAIAIPLCEEADLKMPLFYDPSRSDRHLSYNLRRFLALYGAYQAAKGKPRAADMHALLYPILFAQRWHGTQQPLPDSATLAAVGDDEGTILAARRYATWQVNSLARDRDIPRVVRDSIAAAFRRESGPASRRGAAAPTPAPSPVTEAKGWDRVLEILRGIFAWFESGMGLIGTIGGGLAVCYGFWRWLRRRARIRALHAPR